MSANKYEEAINALDFQKLVAHDLIRESYMDKSVKPYLQAMKYIDFAKRSIEAMKLYTDGTETEAQFCERMKGIK